MLELSGYRRDLTVDDLMEQNRFYSPKEDQYAEVVRLYWGSGIGDASDHNLVANLKRVKHGLVMWRKQADRNEQKEICRLKEILLEKYQRQVLFTTDQPANVIEIMPWVPNKVGFSIIIRKQWDKWLWVWVISQNQLAFMVGRQISDNILVVHELLHSMRHDNDEGTNFMALKLDMAKACDRVEWSFLNAMLLKLGFDDVFYQWVMECVQTVSYRVVINGEATGYITPSRGLQQGDPMSPFLFLICAKGFSSLIHNEEMLDHIREITVNPFVEPISHVFFVDDSVLFCWVIETEVGNVKGLLHQYAERSGQFVNMEKRSVHFSEGCFQTMKDQLSQELGIRHQEGFGKYLGIQADFGTCSKMYGKDWMRGLLGGQSSFCRSLGMRY
ncbi:hypothetical protein ACFX1W_006599 [Malus domestica]